MLRPAPQSGGLWSEALGFNTGGLHVDQALTNVSVMYRNGEFISEEICPVLPVDHQSDKYFVYGPDNLRDQDDSRRPGAHSNTIDWSLSTNPFYCDGHALNQYIPDEARENADAAIDLDTDVTIQLTDKIFLRREINLVNMLLANMTTVDLSGSAGANQFDNAAADPVEYFDAQKEVIAAQIGKRPNSIAMARPAWRGFRNNPNVLKHIFGTSVVGTGQQITIEQAKALLEVDNLVIGDAIQITSPEGITPTVSKYVWGAVKDSAGNATTNGALSLLYYRPRTPGLRTVALGYQFTWQKGRLGSLVYKDRAAKRHSDWIEVMRYYDLRTISAAAGLLYKKCTAN